MHDKYKVRASLIELYKRDTKVVKGQGENIYYNGSDNLYPIRTAFLSFSKSFLKVHPAQLGLYPNILKNVSI